MSTSRRNFLKIGLAAGGTGLAARGAGAQNKSYLQYLCPPDNLPRDLPDQEPSPPARLYCAPLFAPQVMKPFDSAAPLGLPPDPDAHQLYDEFPPRKFYEIYQRECMWHFHPDPPYSEGSWVWGWQGMMPDPETGRPVPLAPTSSPGPTYHARYGEPVLVRLHNALPPVGQSNVTFALPSTTTHLHNGHTASESDGNPQDWIDSGEFWDHHYGNFPSGMDPREKLTTLWYHDHRLDFTAANVYAGLFGFYLLFDENDSNDENDPNPEAWRLPSGEYDVPLVIQDIQFDSRGQAHFQNWNTDGMIGDRMTVNRIITPYFRVEPRKYRFRILNGGPSRFYQLRLKASRKVNGTDRVNFQVITGDGNFLPEPVWAEDLYMSVAQRFDVILDFSDYRPGDHLYLYNVLEQINGRGPTNRLLDFGDPLTELMRFDVVEPRCWEKSSKSTSPKQKCPDPSRVPDFFRPLPSYDLSDVRRHRTWVFDYDGGLWTINNRIMDPNRIDAGIDQGSIEKWTFRNGGNDWSHPIHCHFTEFILLEVNGKPFDPRVVETVSGQELRLLEYLGRPPSEREPIRLFMGGARRDVATILPNDELKVVLRFNDFLGKHVMHCHNVVHEDHAMMIRWDIMEPGSGFDGPRDAREVYGFGELPPEPFPDPSPLSPPHMEIHPGNPTQQDG